MEVIAVIEIIGIIVIIIAVESIMKQWSFFLLFLTCSFAIAESLFSSNCAVNDWKYNKIQLHSRAIANDWTAQKKNTSVQNRNKWKPLFLVDPVPCASCIWPWEREHEQASPLSLRIQHQETCCVHTAPAVEWALHSSPVWPEVNKTKKPLAKLGWNHTLSARFWWRD